MPRQNPSLYVVTEINFAEPLILLWNCSQTLLNHSVKRHVNPKCQMCVPFDTGGMSSASWLHPCGSWASVSGRVRRKSWKWIGHVLRKDRQDDCAMTLGWTPEGMRNMGRPKTKWKRVVEMERSVADWKTCVSARRAAENRQQWMTDVQALCTP